MADLASILVYAGIFVLAASLVYAGEKYKRRVVIALGLLVPIIYAALRLNVGIDYENYVNISSGLSSLSFAKFFSSPFSKIYEHSLYYITVFARLFPVWQIVFFGTYSAFTILPFYFGVKKVNPKYTWLAVLFYLLMFYAPSLNGIRQFAAISIVFYATMFYVHSKRAGIARFVYFTVLILLAVGFHASAVCGFLVLPIIWLSKVLAKKPAGRIIFYSLMTMGAIVLLEYLVTKNIENIPIINRYVVYADSERGTAPVPNLIPRLFPLLVGGWMLFKKNLRNERTMFYYILTCVTLVLACLGFFIPYGYRVSDYFMIFQIPLFIEIIAGSGREQQRVYLKILVTYAVIYFLYSSVLRNSHGIMPYQLLLWEQIKFW